MESGTTESIRGLLHLLSHVNKCIPVLLEGDAHNLNRVSPSVVPVVLITHNLGVCKAILIHQSAESSGNLSLLGGSNDGSGVGGVVVLGLILRSMRVRDLPPT